MTDELMHHVPVGSFIFSYPFLSFILPLAISAEFNYGCLFVLERGVGGVLLVEKLVTPPFLPLYVVSKPEVFIYQSKPVGICVKL